MPDQPGNDFDAKPVLTRAQARKKALSFVGARVYKWQRKREEAWLKKIRNNPQASYFPRGELVIARVSWRRGKPVRSRKLVLAYRFDVYAHQPLSRAIVYVDAKTGEVVGRNEMLKHADTGTAQTRYSGTRAIATTPTADGRYRLRDDSRGFGIETFNLQGSDDYYGEAAAFTDNDNQWTAAEHNNAARDNAALDAHWAGMKIYDYFKNVHGRDSYNGEGGAIYNHVHYGTNFTGAFWSGYSVVFGDGDPARGIGPLTTLDIAAHEIGHAFCQATAGLVYSYEPGALNEGLSDIWAALVEHHTDPAKATWTIGEDANHVMRSLSDPNAYGQPDTYKGQYWAGGSDDGGVHTNSGVVGHWFYLLATGKSGTNDLGHPYAVTGIGLEKAGRVVYRMETAYLSYYSEFRNARSAAIQAAADLFGETSPERAQVIRAWEAVGVYETPDAPAGLAATAASASRIALAWTDNSTGEEGFRIERSLYADRDFAQIAAVGPDETTYSDAGLLPGNVYHYRVLAYAGRGVSAPSNVASAASGPPPILMTDGSVTTCDALFLDSGGTGSYVEDQRLTLTLVPASPGKVIQVAFSALDINQGRYSYDVLRVYDGAGTGAPELPVSNEPGQVFTATNPEGKLTFSFSSSDENYPGAGWQANVSCVILPPGNLTAVATPDNGVNLAWTDNSGLETGFAVERSTDPVTGFVRIAALGPDATTYTDAGLAPNATYYYRVKTYTDGYETPYSAVALATVGNLPVRMATAVVTTCGATFQDGGGAGNYASNAGQTMTFAPATPGGKVRVRFTAFSTQAGNDVLYAYDGATTRAPLLGSYSGKALPPVLSAGNPEGKITFRFVSDGAVTEAGWQAEVSCATLPSGPTNLTATTVPGNQVNLSWTDNGANETGFKIERSVYPDRNFTQVAAVGPDVTTYANRDLSGNTAYYYRVRATADNFNSPHSNVAGAVVSKRVIPIANATVTTCDALFMDTGGTENYRDEGFVMMTLVPATPGSKIQLNFTAFDIRRIDLLTIYDGVDFEAPRIAWHHGDDPFPQIVSASNPEGKLTIVFNPFDDNQVGTGWQAKVSCVALPSTPTNFAVKAASSTRLTLSWTDNGTNETGFKIERSLLPTFYNPVEIATVGANVTSYTDAGLTPNQPYYYRVRSYVDEYFNTQYTDWAGGIPTNRLIRMGNGTVTTCDATFTDSGGLDTPGRNENYTLTIAPATPGRMVQVNFLDYQVWHLDAFYVYDGASTGAPVLGFLDQFFSGPQAFTATNPEGKLTFRFTAAGYFSSHGWIAAVKCVPPAAARLGAGLETAAPGLRASLHPNPVRDKLAVTLDEPAAGVTRTAVTDGAGKVRLLDGHGVAAEKVLELDVRALEPGLYLLHVQTEKGRRVLKFVKE